MSPTAWAGVDKVFLVSPFVPNMVELTAILIEAAKRASVQHIVKLSALAQQRYANLKRKLAQEFGCDRTSYTNSAIALGSV